MANIPDEPLDPLVVVFLLQQSTIIDKNIKSQNNKQLQNITHINDFKGKRKLNQIYKCSYIFMKDNMYNIY